MTTSLDTYRPAGAVGIAPPVGADVRLLRDRRAGRVVAWSQGGLLCRVRLEGGADAGATIECAACELVLAPEPGEDAEAGAPGAKGDARRDVDPARAPTALLRVVTRGVTATTAAGDAARASRDAGEGGQEHEPRAESVIPAVGRRSRWELLPSLARRC